MDGLFLGIDCGTQGTKALVLDAGSGAVLGLGSAAHAPPEGEQGRREQDPADWLRALRTAVAEALACAGVPGSAIRALAVSGLGQQHGLVMLDGQGQVLRPAKLWCDTESSAENEDLLAALGGPAGSLERLGLVIAPGYTLSPSCSPAPNTCCCPTTSSITGSPAAPAPSRAMRPAPAITMCANAPGPPMYWSWSNPARAWRRRSRNWWRRVTASAHCRQQRPRRLGSTPAPG